MQHPVPETIPKTLIILFRICISVLLILICAWLTHYEDGDIFDISIRMEWKKKNLRQIIFEFKNVGSCLLFFCLFSFYLCNSLLNCKLQDPF